MSLVKARATSRRVSHITVTRPRIPRPHRTSQATNGAHPGQKQGSQDSLEIRGKASTDTALLGGRVDTDEDKVGLEDALVDIGGEEEVATARLTDDVDETRLVDRKCEIGAVPSIDPSLVQVDDGDLNVGTLEGDDRAGRAA